MSSVSFMDEDGIQKGWKKIVRKMPAMISAQKMVLSVSMMPSLASDAVAIHLSCRGLVGATWVDVAGLSSDWARFDDHKGLRPGVIVGQSDQNAGLMSGRRHLGQPFCGPAGQVHFGLAAFQVGYGHILPGDAHAQAGAERLGTGLFRGPSFGIGAGSVVAAFSLGLFDVGEDAVAEAVAEPLQRAFYALDVAQVGADAQYHAGCLFSLARFSRSRGTFASRAKDLVI